MEPQPGLGLENCQAQRGHGQGTPGASHGFRCSRGTLQLQGAPRQPGTCSIFGQSSGGSEKPQGHSGCGEPPPTGILVPSIPGMQNLRGRASSLQPSLSSAGARKPELLWLLETQPRPRWRVPTTLKYICSQHGALPLAPKPEYCWWCCSPTARALECLKTSRQLKHKPGKGRERNHIGISHRLNKGSSWRCVFASWRRIRINRERIYCLQIHANCFKN